MVFAHLRDMFRSRSDDGPDDDDKGASEHAFPSPVAIRNHGGKWCGDHGASLRASNDIA